MIFGTIRSRNSGSSAESNSGSNGRFSQRFCDERHQNIDVRQGEIKEQVSELKKDTREGFRAVFQKLDRIQEHLNK